MVHDTFPSFPPNKKKNCRSYWSKIHDHEERAFCSFCKRKENVEVLENEQHIWINYVNSGQHLAWETSRTVWEKTTSRPWPRILIGLIRGTVALTLESDNKKDTEKLCILISMTMWAIWKSRNKNSINNQDIAICKTSALLRALISEQVRKAWNVMHFLDRKLSKPSGQRDALLCSILKQA